MDVNTIKDNIKPFKNNGVGTLSVKELSLFMLQKIDALENMIIKQTTFCKTHMEEKKFFQKGTIQALTIFIALLAVGVSVYVAFN